MKKSLLVVLLLIVAAVAVCYFRPLEVLSAMTRTGIRFHGGRSHFVDVNGERTHYYAYLSGKPDAPKLLLIHGLGGSSLDWAASAPKYAKAGFDVYTPDLLGFGETVRPNIQYTIPEQAAFVNDFVHVVGVCDSGASNVCQQDVVGWSMGGWIAMRYTVDHPDQVKRLVLDDAAGVNYVPDFGPEVFSAANIATVRKLSHLLEPSAGRMPTFVARDFIRHAKATCCSTQIAVRHMETREDVMDPYLSQIKAPTLINWGDEDLLIPLAVGHKTQQLIAGSNLVVYEGCGHLAPSRCEKQVTAATLAFLQANPPPVGQSQTIEARPKQRPTNATGTQPR